MRAATLGFVGDIMLGRMVDRELPTRPPESFWGSALPVLRSATAVFGNLECAISDRGTPWGRINKTFIFRARPSAIEVLRAGGIRCVSLANNHVLDFGDEALLDTIRHLDAAGIAHAGAGGTIEAAMAPATIEISGLKMGFLALTDNEPEFAATTERPGTYYTPINTSPLTLEPLRRTIETLRARKTELIILSAHWGPNMVEQPPQSFRMFARAAIDLGVDIFHGHSAHVFQGTERHGRGLILYDTGDFLDDYAVDPELRNDWSFVFLVELDSRGLARLRMIPVRLGMARVDLAGPKEAQAIRARMLARCAPLGVHPTTTAEGLELRL